MASSPVQSKQSPKPTRSQYRTSAEEDDYDEDEDGSPINTDLAFSASKLDVEIEKDYDFYNSVLPQHLNILDRCSSDHFDLSELIDETASI